jgi:hypothetical protein
MALDTKLNLSNQKFEQASGDTLILSGNTVVFGNFSYSPSKNITTYAPRTIIDYGYYSGNTGVIISKESGSLNSIKSNIEVIGKGTVTLTNGSGNVVGNGTNFLDATSGLGVSYWMAFHVTDSSNRTYKIALASVQSNTGATILQVFSESQVLTGHVDRTLNIFTGTTGTYAYKIVANYAKDLYSSSLGNNSYTSNFGAAFGGHTVANGQTSFASGFYTHASGNQSFAMGQNTVASGEKSFAGGWGFSLSPDKRVRASGQASFNFSQNLTTQTAGHGALAQASAILGGYDHHIPSTSQGSVVIGGNMIKVSESTPYTVHMPKVRIGLGSNATMLVDNTNDNLIVRDASSGELKIRSAASITGSGGGEASNTEEIQEEVTPTTPQDEANGFETRVLADAGTFEGEDYLISQIQLFKDNNK